MPRKAVVINAERGKRFKKLLNDANIKYKDFAEEIGYTPEHISYVLNGRRNLTDDMAKQIIKYFPTKNIKWLLGEDDDENIAPLQITIPGIDIVRKCLATAQLLRECGIELVQITPAGSALPICDIGGFISCEMPVEIRISKNTMWRGNVTQAENMLLEICEYAVFKTNWICREA